MESSQFIFEFLKIYFSLVSRVFSHPFVIAITIFFLSNKALERIIPDKKEKTIAKFVDIKNLLNEVELIYSRIVNTGKSINKRIREGKNPKEDIEIFEKTLPTEINSISQIINEQIPSTWAQFSNEIEVYFEDEKLNQAANAYFQEFKLIHDFIVNKLPNHPDNFKKKLSEIEELSSKKIKSCEKELIAALRLAKSIKLSNK